MMLPAAEVREQIYTCCLPVLLDVPSSSPSLASDRSESTVPESWEMLIAVICSVTGLGELGLKSQQT